MVKKFKEVGWELVSVKGNHHKLRKNGHTYIIPVHGKHDLGPGGTKVALKKLKRGGIVEVVRYPARIFRDPEDEERWLVHFRGLGGGDVGIWTEGDSLEHAREMAVPFCQDGVRQIDTPELVRILERTPRCR